MVNDLTTIVAGDIPIKKGARDSLAYKMSESVTLARLAPASEPSNSTLSFDDSLTQM